MNPLAKTIKLIKPALARSTQPMTTIQMESLKKGPALRN
jgi:hypothetical protein